MLKTIKHNWHRLTRGVPGQRFQRRYHRKREPGRGGMGRWLAILAGTMLTAVGIILIPAPGPGVIVVIAGASLIAQESLAAARLLDHAELRIRGMTRDSEAFWSGSSAAAKAALAFTLVLVLAGCGYGVWYLFTDA